jgi:hypothetical protein
MVGWANHHANSRSSEQDTLPIVFLISKQVAPYQTRGGTCYPRMSTPKIWSLADGRPHLSHHAMAVLTISTIPTITQTTTLILTCKPIRELEREST